MAITSTAENRVLAELTTRRSELEDLLRELVHFDTRSPDRDFAPRDEAALQQYLAQRLSAVGLAVEVWEPDATTLDMGRYPRPDGYTFRGRPQLVARAEGTGGGRSLLFNGHIDVVGVEPREQWTRDPFAADAQQGRLYGRGACDMKAGVAAMVFATEVLRNLDVPLAGDLLINTVTDEEITGGGSLASIAHGVTADAALIPEPTGLTAWLGTRGSLLTRITIEGRAGHAGYPQDHWSGGGAVNALEKTQLVLEGLQRLREEWRARPDTQHGLLYASSLVPTAISAGQWMVAYPARCTLECHIQFSPTHAEQSGSASAVRRELVQQIEAVAQSDSWLTAHPPRVEFLGESPAHSLAEEEPICATLLDSMSALGLKGGVADRTTFFDGPIFSHAGTPAIAFGPGDVQRAHAVDEFVPLDEVLSCAGVLAASALRFCGEA